MDENKEKVKHKINHIKLQINYFKNGAIRINFQSTLERIKTLITFLHKVKTL